MGIKVPVSSTVFSETSASASATLLSLCGTDLAIRVPAIRRLLTRKWFSIPLWIMLTSVSLHSQSPKRIAIISGNGQLERSNPAFALGEDRVTQGLNAKLSGQPGIEVVGLNDHDKIIEIQNQSNSDRYSPETAAEIGKLTSAEFIVIVNLANAGQTSHQENSPVSAKTIAVVQAEVTARLIDLSSGVTIATPESKCEQSMIAMETKTFPYIKTTGPGLPEAFNELWTKASDSLTTDLAAKLKESLVHVSSSLPAAAPEAGPPKVLGIDSGSVFINRGSQNGIKVRDRFQIVRIVPTALTDDNGAPVTKRQPICVLTIDDASEKTASGKCPDGLAQKGDIAEPLPAAADDRKESSSLAGNGTEPAMLLECENSGPCNSAWRLNGSEGDAVWYARNPVRAKLTIVRWTPQDILIRRVDSSDGDSAVYTGSIKGDHVSGTVIWSTPNHPGASAGKWSASVPQTVCQPQASLSPAEALQIGQNALMFSLERQALDCYTAAAASGDATAQTAVGFIYLRGYNNVVAQDYEKAFFWLLKAADQGVYSAQKEVADMYQLGRGTKKDLTLSKFYGDKAAEQKRDFERQQDRADRARSDMLHTFVFGAVLGAALF